MKLKTEVLSKEQRMSAFKMKYRGKKTFEGFKPYVVTKSKSILEVRIDDTSPLETIDPNRLSKAFFIVEKDAMKNFGANLENYGSDNYTYNSQTADKPPYYSTSLVFSD